jgi:O-antigen ligase
MNLPGNLGGLSPGLALAIVGALLALLAWLSWRKPTWLFLLALAALAIRPELLWGGPAVGYEWGLHQTLLVLALTANALHYGLRRSINWPVLALLASFVLSLAFGNLHPKLTLPFMLESLALLALPFAFTQVVLEPGSRRVLALTIMLLPLLSVALGGLLQLLGLREVFSYERWVGEWYRLEGAWGDAATFAALAFAGFAVALHEMTRPGRRFATPLAILNLVLALLSGTRTAILASAVLVVAYTYRSDALRDLVRRNRGKALAGAGVIAAALIAYWPTLLMRMFQGASGSMQLSGRDQVWSFFFGEFLQNPLFGRGIGAGFVAGQDWLTEWAYALPHNEYLHLLVNGGIAGFGLVGVAIALWYRQLLTVASPNDREFLIALLPALGTYAITGNVLSYPTALALYAYLGIQLTRPSVVWVPAFNQAERVSHAA